MKLLAKTALPFALFIILVLYACRKEVGPQKQQDVPVHQLDIEDEAILKKGQAIQIYDATALHDSASFVSPPTGRLYKWEIQPKNNCVTLWGNYQHGKALMTFHCAGHYQVFAKVYDSSSHVLTAATDTLEIDVEQDSLYAAKALAPSDEIRFNVTLAKPYSVPHTPSDPPDDILIQLFSQTSRGFEFDGNEISVSTTHSGRDHFFVFADSVRLSTYPFARGQGRFWPASGFIEVHGVQVGVPETLHITWLGKTYSDTVTLPPSTNRLKFDWDNSGPVKIAY